MIDKRALFERWKAVLLERRGHLCGAQGAARDGTRVDGDHRPENRGERAAVTSQGYLAAGLAQRLAELDAAIELLDRLDPAARRRVAVGAVVTVEDEQGERRFAVLPGGDGTEVDGLAVVSPESPLARPLLGLGEEDEAVVALAGTEREVVVVAVG